ncbi:MAG: programmed cell death protein 10 [Duncaniella sp.]|uniref:hypothetical protein n=1 Tax=Duncaniella sp. TaxID=2518496 RepID=UPI0023C2EBC0|nr:hypothetical protein [Duncaniella sp.]MDE6091342.1 programmed cell death protein 10 [Duncaniella sp.]
MANETPNHEYIEVSDDAKDGTYHGCAPIMSRIVLSASVPFIVLTVISFCCEWEIMRWVWLGLSLIIILFGFYIRVYLEKDIREDFVETPSPRLREAQRAKTFLGYDFGNDFKLRMTGSHDYSEILLDFEEDAFRPLGEFCRSQKSYKIQTSTPDEITITEIKHHIVVKEKVFEFEEELTKTGFTKTESFYDPSLSKKYNLWIKYLLQCEVDYENMTLKMFYVGW